MHLIANIARLATILALCPSAARADTVSHGPIVLGPENPFALALDAMLPTVAADDNMLASWQTTKQAVIAPTGSDEIYLVTCTTSYFSGRAPDPVERFQGCKATKVSEAPDGVAVWKLGDLFEKSIPTTSTPPGSVQVPDPICPRCSAAPDSGAQ